MHWAAEAFDALEIAWGLIGEKYPNPSEDEKLELMSFAPAIASMNRGIKNKDLIKKAYKFVLQRAEEDFKVKDPGEPIYYSVLFLLGYLDSHIAFGIITEKRSEDIMDYLSHNYPMDFQA